MRSPNDYNTYLSAKLVMGIFAITVIIIGPLYLIDLFFLHQRGRVFNALGLFLNMGASAGPASSGFVEERKGRVRVTLTIITTILLEELRTIPLFLLPLISLLLLPSE